MILQIEQIREIHEKAVLAGLHDARNKLLLGIDIQYAASLKLANNPSDQLLCDLQTMNADGKIANSVPLVRWLSNAGYAVRFHPDREKFFKDFEGEVQRRAETEPRSWIPQSLKGIKIPLPNRDGAPLPKPAAGIVAKRAALDASQKSELSKQIANALTLDDLDLIMQKCFSNARIRMNGPDRQQSLPVIALQCVELAEREKITVILMRFVLASARSTPELRDAVIAVFPEVQSAGQPFADIVSLAANRLTENARQIAEQLHDRALLQVLGASVAELKCYKGLHEAIHQVQLSPPPVVPIVGDPARALAFRQDLRRYLTLVSTARTRSNNALCELPPGSAVLTSESGWIAMLGNCIAEAETALRAADMGAVELALNVTARTIDPLLGQLNRRIFDIALGLLDPAVEALRSFVVQPGPPGADPIEQVLVAMGALRLALLMQVVEHARWQETYDALFSLDANFKVGANAPFTKFARQWPFVRRQVQILADIEGSDDWKNKLRDLAGDVDQALIEVERSFAVAPGTKPDEVFNSIMSDAYGALRAGTEEQFFNVDSALKRNCNDLTQIQAPLTMIRAEIGA